MILTNIKQLVGIQSEDKLKTSGFEMNKLNIIENAHKEIAQDCLKNFLNKSK